MSKLKKSLCAGLCSAVILSGLGSAGKDIGSEKFMMFIPRISVSGDNKTDKKDKIKVVDCDNEKTEYAFFIEKLLRKIF